MDSRLSILHYAIPQMCESFQARSGTFSAFAIYRSCKKRLLGGKVCVLLRINDIKVKPSVYDMLTEKNHYNALNIIHIHHNYSSSAESE